MQTIHTLPSKPPEEFCTVRDLPSGRIGVSVISGAYYIRTQSYGDQAMLRFEANGNVGPSAYSGNDNSLLRLLPKGSSINITM